MYCTIYYIDDFKQVKVIRTRYISELARPYYYIGFSNKTGEIVSEYGAFRVYALAAAQGVKIVPPEPRGKIVDVV